MGYDQPAHVYYALEASSDYKGNLCQDAMVFGTIGECAQYNLCVWAHAEIGFVSGAQSAAVSEQFFSCYPLLHL